MRDFLQSTFVFLFRNRVNRTHPNRLRAKENWWEATSIPGFSLRAAPTPEYHHWWQRFIVIGVFLVSIFYLLHARSVFDCLSVFCVFSGGGVYSVVTYKHFLCQFLGVSQFRFHCILVFRRFSDVPVLNYDSYLQYLSVEAPSMRQEN